MAKLVLTNFLADGTAKTSWDISVMRRLGLNRLVLRYGSRIVFERAQATFLEQRTALDANVRSDMWEGFNRPEVRDHLRKMCAGYDASLGRIARLYPDIESTTLVLWADRDPHFPIAQANAVADALPNSKLQILGGASHWFMWDRAEETAKAIDDFASV